MGIPPRQVCFLLAAAGAAAAVLLLPAIYAFGLLVGPPRPAAASTAAPALVGQAIWARAGGGRARQLRPIDQIAIAHLAACLLMAPGSNDNERIRECGHVIPALRGLEYLSSLHVADSGVQRRSFIGGHGAFATTVWMSRSWSREDFVNTLAARGDYGFGWRGVVAAASGYFARDPEALTLPQAALLASRLGDSAADAWCEPAAAAAMRNRVLAAMRDHGAIGEHEFARASVAPLDLAPSPEGRPPCRD